MKLKTKLLTKPPLVVNSQSLTHGLANYWSTWLIMPIILLYKLYCIMKVGVVHKLGYQLFDVFTRITIVILMATCTPTPNTTRKKGACAWLGS